MNVARNGPNHLTLSRTETSTGHRNVVPALSPQGDAALPEPAVAANTIAATAAVVGSPIRSDSATTPSPRPTATARAALVAPNTRGLLRAAPALSAKDNSVASFSPRGHSVGAPPREPGTDGSIPNR